MYSANSNKFILVIPPALNNFLAFLHFPSLTFFSLSLCLLHGNVQSSLHSFHSLTSRSYMLLGALHNQYEAWEWTALLLKIFPFVRIPLSNIQQLVRWIRKIVNISFYTVLCAESFCNSRRKWVFPCNIQCFYFFFHWKKVKEITFPCSKLCKLCIYMRCSRISDAVNNQFDVAHCQSANVDVKTK